MKVRLYSPSASIFPQAVEAGLQAFVYFTCRFRVDGTVSLPHAPSPVPALEAASDMEARFTSARFETPRRASVARNDVDVGTLWNPGGQFGETIGTANM